MKSIVKKLVELKRNIFSLRYLILEEKKNKGLGISRDWSALFAGYSSEKPLIYNMKKEERKYYLNDFSRDRTVYINDKHALILNDKWVFEEVMRPYQITAESIGFIVNGKVFIDNQIASEKEIIQTISEYKRIIIKKNKGAEGKGVFDVEINQETLYVNSKRITQEQFFDFLSKLEDHLIVEYLKQPAYANKIYPGSVNTIRVLMMRDPETNRFFVASAIHKFGSEKTKPVDNVGYGGLTALIDLETGILKNPFLHTKGNKVITPIKRHPDTKEVIEGVKIPGWKKEIEKLIMISNQLKGLHYIGWDAIITEEGLRIVEGNSNSDIKLNQIHEPLLKNNKVKKFYRYHNVIK